MNAPEARTVAEPYVLNERDERGVATLTLNRPQQFNALSAEMMTALQAELDALARDDSARVIVLAARGKAFCPGHDLKQLKSKPSLDYYRRLFAQCSKLMLSLQRLPQPVIARVHGIATAAGCQLVATCDLAVAATGRASPSVGSTSGCSARRRVLRSAAMSGARRRSRCW
jgi:enoyl-CoA hydratase/carnithine racemase